MKFLIGLLIFVPAFAPAIARAHEGYHVHPHGWDLQWLFWVIVSVLALTFIRVKK